MSEKKIALVPGSYDPATLGHVDVIRRAATLFDTVYAVVLVNAEKRDSGLYSPEARLQILQCACRDIPNFRCCVCDGLTSDIAAKLFSTHYVKGVRNGTDFDYEYGLAEIMRQFSPDMETVWIPARPSLSHVSSTYARERLRFGCDLSDVADAETAALMRELLEKK